MMQEQPRPSSPEDGEQAIRLFRQIIANEWETKGEQRADLELVHTPFLKEEEMKLFVRLQELMHKDQKGTLSCEDAQDCSCGDKRDSSGVFVHA